MARTYRPLTLRTESVLPTGPKQFQWAKAHVKQVGGPGQPPPGFVGGQNSASEWYVYWAGFKILTPDRDPRESGPPFYGNEYMRYQKAQLGSHTRALGSAVADFVFTLGAQLIIVRLQSSYFHLFAPAQKQALDAIQLTNLLGMEAGAYNVDVVDIYEQSFLTDPTGQAIIVLMKETLGLIRRVDPLTAGVARVVRSPAHSLET